MNKDKVVEIMIDTVEDIIKKSNLETGGAETKGVRRNVVSEIILALDKVVEANED